MSGAEPALSALLRYRVTMLEVIDLTHGRQTACCVSWRGNPLRRTSVFGSMLTGLVEERNVSAGDLADLNGCRNPKFRGVIKGRINRGSEVEIGFITSNGGRRGSNRSVWPEDDTIELLRTRIERA
jgi:hypothetical protein